MRRLFDAVKLGMESRGKARLVDGLGFANPFPSGTDEADAWRAGYENDLRRWVGVRDRQPEAREKGRPPQGRFRAHDAVVFNAHTGSPDHGEFHRYIKGRPGWARVLLNRAGTTEVPVVSLTRPVRKEAAA